MSKAYLHIPTPSPSPSSFIIVSMVTGSLTGRMGLEAILPVGISTMLNFDGDSVGTCKQALSARIVNINNNNLSSVEKQIVHFLHLIRT